MRIECPTAPRRTYEFIEMLAELDFNRVYLARDSVEGRHWAIKELYPPDEDVAGFHRLFAREAHAQMQVHHPSLPRVAEFFAHESNAYLVKEFIDGRTLKDMVLNNGGFMPVDTVQGWIGHITDGIKTLHACTPPMIAQGLKPNNIVLPTVGRPRIMDLGTARFMKGDVRRDLLTKLTPTYTSPEQSFGQEPDVRSDVYSLGALSYFLLTGQDPIPTRGQVPSARDLRADLPAPIVVALETALQMDPRKRFPSADAFRQGFMVTPADHRGRKFVVDEVHVQFTEVKHGERVLGTVHVSQDSAEGRIQVDSDAGWLRPTEPEVKGRRADVDFIIETSVLAPGQTHYAKLILGTGVFRKEVPVTVNFQ